MALFGTNLEYGQRYNRRVVLEIIRLHGPLSRAEIARRTGLSAQTISNIMEQLKREDLVIERARRSGARGQPPINIEINPTAAYSFGISFDHNHLTVIALNLGGEICGEAALPLTHAAPAVLLPLIESAVHTIIATRQIPVDRIWGAGIVLPALVRRGDPTALGPTSVPEWRDYPLAARLEERLGFPVLVDNDATAGAIGELLYGAGRQLRTFVYVYIGVGVGGGIILDGRPYRGAYGMSGELGHMVSAPGGRACPCGNEGCLERYASLSAAFAALTGEPEGTTPVDIGAISDAFARSDPRLMAWMADCAGHLRTIIVSVENLFDPEAVIIGGLVPEAMLDALIAAIEPLRPSVSSRHNGGSKRILKAAAGLDTRVLGAASLAIFESMTPDFALATKGGSAEPSEPQPIPLAETS
jgi:predicted NBD/HSP70 family sugar kinase/biotin operon repressor